MTPRTIHQFHPAAEYGDGITNGMLFLQRILRQSGYHSEIYCEHIDQKVAAMVQPLASFDERSTDVLLVHYSLGSKHDGWISNLKCLKSLIYHNITPAQLLPEGTELRRLAKMGRAQLASWGRKTDEFVAVIGDSAANAEELARMGYRSPAAIPMLVDLDRIRNRTWKRDWVRKLSGSRNLLFVGRICEHKGQLDLIRMIERLALISNLPVRLLLVGGTTSPGYLTRIENEISRLGVNDRVWLLGKLDDADLYAIYRTADLYVSLSQHEGFGMPLLEAMALDLPVIAASAENVAKTLGSGGLVLDAHDPDQMAVVAKLVLEEPWLRREMISGQRQMVTRYERPVLVAAFQEHLRKSGVEITLVSGSENLKPCSGRWQIEGPFDSSYSLAIVNRELAKALKRRGETVALVSRDGPGPIKPNEEFLSNNPDLLAMVARADENGIPAATLRNLYPPVVADMKGVMRILANYAWEESGFPTAYADEFNATLDLICVASHFVAKVLRDNGVRTPIRIVGYGIDQVLDDPADGMVEANRAQRDSIFRFLHISSGFPRKGLDVLLAAWGAAFCHNDPVMLVVKTFPNVHNQIDTDLVEWKSHHPDSAPVKLINEDLPDTDIRHLYASADVLVCPSRGEGFGLPIAEALALSKAVVTVAYGGQSDFCSHQTAWLCDFSFAYARTHLGVYDSLWVEPDVVSLSKCLRECYEATPDERAARGEAGRALVRSEYCWDAVAERTQKAVAEVRNFSADALRLPKVGWVSTWNSRCGIAAYSQSLATKAIEPERLVVFANQNATRLVPDESFVRRCWQQGWEDTLEQLYQEIRAAAVDAVVVQFNFGFFALRSFAQLLDRLAKDEIAVIVALHRTTDVERPDISIRLRDAKPSLSLARRILVHSVHDLNRLKALGLVENVALFPMGVPQPVKGTRKEVRNRPGLGKSRLIIATFGYLLPHKGLRELIRATAVLRGEIGNVDLLMMNALYPAAESEAEHQACRREIASLRLERHVSLLTDFIDESEILSLLATSDIVVYPYQESQESASAAVRLGLASLTPVACTPLPIFDDVGSVIARLPGTTPNEIAAGLKQLLSNESALSELAVRQRAWVAAHSWATLGRRLDGLIRGDTSDRFALSRKATMTDSVDRDVTYKLGGEFNR